MSDQQAMAAKCELNDKLITRPFFFLWLSETVFDIGAALMSFALGIWVFEKTGSAEQFSYAFLSAAVPALLVSPFAGVFADRFDRRWVIGICDVLTGAFVVALAVLLFQGSLALIHLYLFNACIAALGVIRNPSFLSAVSAIVPKSRLTQANGFIGLSQAIMQVMTPLVGGYLMSMIGLQGIMLIEVLMVTAGALSIFFAISHVQAAISGTTRKESFGLTASVKESYHSTMKFFGNHPAMISLLSYVILQQSLIVLASTMITPLVLLTYSSEVLGVILTSGALGAVVGSVLLMSKPINNGLIVWVLLSNSALSLCVALAGFTQQSVLWAVCAFFALFFGSLSGGCINSILMRKTPPSIQGGVFAFIGAINLLTMCVVMLAGASTGEYVFEPALQEGGSLAQTVGLYVGTGEGRGYALLFVVAGLVGMILSLSALASRRMRRFDEIVSDHNEQPNEAASMSDVGEASTS
jgi:diaminobutyrate-2-oxoglutarate transaminase